MEKFNAIPAHPVSTKGLKVPGLFKQVLTDLSQSSQDKDFGYNIDVLIPQNFNEVMYSGFQDVINGNRTAKGQARGDRTRWQLVELSHDLRRSKGCSLYREDGREQPK